jgi:hypothetical protein
MSSSTMPLQSGPQPAACASPALSTEQLAAMAAARHRGRKISRAAGVAAFSGWTMAVFSFFSLLGGLFSLDSLALGIGLGIVAYVELKGSKRLRALDEAAPVHLVYNQLALAALIALYCGWGMYQAIFGPSPYDSYLAAGGDTAEMMRGIADLHRAVTSAFYGFLLCVSVVAQGGTAFYYFTRKRHLAAYLRETPEWVLDALRVAVH